MRLTRRDAMAALATLGVTSLAGCSGSEESPEPTSASPRLDDERLDTLTAAAVVLYPSDVDGHREFVATFVDGRTSGRDDYRGDVASTVDDLNEVAREWHGGPFADLSTDARDGLFRELGVGTADSDPDGPLPERIRHFVVEELLYALYASPVGGRLVGIENPIGHPGGIESYQRASMESDGG